MAILSAPVTGGFCKSTLESKAVGFEAVGQSLRLWTPFCAMMIQTPTLPLPMFRQFLTALPLDGVIRIELVDNVPLLKVTRAGQKRLKFLLSKQQQTPLNEAEIAELDKFEEIDDYLSLVNRLIRNM